MKNITQLSEQELIFIEGSGVPRTYQPEPRKVPGYSTTVYSGGQTGYNYDGPGWSSAPWYQGGYYGVGC